MGLLSLLSLLHDTNDWFPLCTHYQANDAFVKTIIIPIISYRTKQSNKAIRQKLSLLHSLLQCHRHFVFLKCPGILDGELNSPLEPHNARYKYLMIKTVETFSLLSTCLFVPASVLLEN